MPEDLWYPTRDSLDFIAAVLPPGPFVEREADEPFQLVVRDEALLESALATARQPYYLTTVDKAAALLRSMAKNHPFVDGNKRMAFAAMLTFLWANGHVFVANVNEAGDLVLDVASSQPPMDWEVVGEKLRRYVMTLDEATAIAGRGTAPPERLAWQIALVPDFMREIRGK